MYRFFNKCFICCLLLGAFPKAVNDFFFLFFVGGGWLSFVVSFNNYHLRAGALHVVVMEFPPSVLEG